jgi:hypothetical protein
VLRKIFGCEKDYASGQYRIIHITELCRLCTLSDTVMILKTRRQWWAGHAVNMGAILVWKPLGKLPL